MSSSQRLWIIGAWVVLAVAALGGIALTPYSTAFAMGPAILLGLAGIGLGVIALIQGWRPAMGVLLGIALLVFASNIRGEVEGSPNAGQAFDAASAAKLGLFALALVCGLGMLPRTLPRLLSRPGIFLSLFVAWATITAPLSLAPIYSLGMVFGMVAWLVFGAAVGERFEMTEIALVLMLALSAFLTGSLFMYFFVPELGQFFTLGAYRLKGLASTPNEAAQMAAIFLICGVAYVMGGGAPRIARPWMRPWLLVSAVMALAVLAMAQTRGAVLGLVCAVVAMAFQRLRLAWLGLFIALLLIPTIGAWVLASPDPQNFLSNEAAKLSRSGGTSELTSFAGRTAIWGFALDQIGNRPITGYGYGAGARVLVEKYATRWGETTGSAHNAFIQTTLDLGLVGGGLLVAVFAWSFVSLFRSPHPFRDGMFILVLVTCLLESAVSKAANAIVLIWMCSLFVRDEAPAAATGPEPEEERSPSVA